MAKHYRGSDLAQRLQRLEMEMQNLRGDIRALNEENEWLREDLDQLMRGFEVLPVGVPSFVRWTITNGGRTATAYVLSYYADVNDNRSSVSWTIHANGPQGDILAAGGHPSSMAIAMDEVEEEIMNLLSAGGPSLAAGHENVPSG